MSRPAFAHPILERLYERDYFIDDAVLRDILALGPEAAVPELLKITEATLQRAEAGSPPETDWTAHYYFLHALHLLHDLQAPEAFDVYRRLLHLDAAHLEFWFGDDLFEELPALLARAAQDRLPELLALLETSTLPLEHRLLAGAALSRLAIEQPVLRPAIGTFLQQYLRHLIGHAGQLAQLLPPDAGPSGFTAPEYLGWLLVDVQEASLRELEPELRQLHRLGVVDKAIAGGEAEIDFDLPPNLRPSPDIFARYEQLRAEPDNYSPFHPDAAALARRRAEQEARHAQIRRAAQLQQPRVVLPKVGRNDPCPCGSGQKHKKCCGA